MNAPALPVIIDDDDIETPMAPEGWTVHDEDSAAWAADVILSYEERCERIKRQHVSVLGRAQKELDRAKAFFGPMLRTWAEHNLPPKKGKTQPKTIHLSTASLSFRTKRGGIFVQDEEACLEWAEANLHDGIRREVVRKLDVERAKHAGERALSVAMFAALGEVEGLEDMTEEEAGLAILNKASESLPPGMVRRDDEETFEIKAPGAKGSK